MQAAARRTAASLGEEPNGGLPWPSTDPHAIAASGGDDMTDLPMRQTKTIEIGRHRRHVTGCDDKDETNAAVERPPHFRQRNRAFALQPVENRWQDDCRSVDIQRQAVGNDTDDVF